MKLIASIPKLKVLKGGFEKKKEIYVVSAWVDASTPPAAGGLRGRISKIGRNINTGDEAHSADVRVSPVLTEIKKGDSVSLSGNGFILYPEKDPGGSVAIYFAVVESDEDLRELTGKIIEALDTSGVALKVLSVLGNLSGPVSLLLPIVQKLPGLLKSIGNDDVFLTHLHSGYLSNRYGVRLVDLESRVDDSLFPSRRKMPFGNDNVEGELLIEVSE